LLDSLLQEMLAWLSSLQSLLPRLATLPSPTTVVMGNQACDLDSGVSCLTLAFHRATAQPGTTVLPVFNINSQDFSLKTELVAVLAEENIHAEHLIFRDTLDLASMKNLQLVLVDHNVLTEEDKELESRVVEIIDHHAKETDHENATIEPVGSCSSLVLKQILTENPSFQDLTCMRMTLKTILLDTVELQPAAKRVTPLDVEMVEKCEEVLGPQDRGEMFRRLMEEKCRVDHLTPGQLCRRDLKVVSKDGVRIALSSVPMLARQWTELAGVEKEVEQFLSAGEFTVLLVIGINIDKDNVTRDIVLAGDEASDSYKTVKAALENNSEPCLGLEHDETVKNFMRYSQQNHAASRKQILPIVKQAL